MDDKFKIFAIYNSGAKVNGIQVIEPNRANIDWTDPRLARDTSGKVLRFATREDAAAATMALRIDNLFSDPRTQVVLEGRPKAYAFIVLVDAYKVRVATDTNFKWFEADVEHPAFYNKHYAAMQLDSLLEIVQGEINTIRSALTTGDAELDGVLRDELTVHARLSKFFFMKGADRTKYKPGLYAQRLSFLDRPDNPDVTISYYLYEKDGECHMDMYTDRGGGSPYDRTVSDKASWFYACKYLFPHFK